MTEDVKTAPRPRIAIPVPHSEAEYADRSLPKYLSAIEEAGGEPVVVGLELSNQEIARVVAGCHGILLPGSKADINPQRYGAENRHPKTAPADEGRTNADELLLQDAFNMRKPVLGICYGLQSLNVWRSGNLVQHVETEVNHQPGREVARAHHVRLEPGSKLAEIIPGEMKSDLWVNSSHHQAANQVGDGLRVAARAEDGVIEAIEGTSADQFVIAVQWHPERTFADDKASRAIFHALVAAASEMQNSARAVATDFESI